MGIQKIRNDNPLKQGLKRENASLESKRELVIRNDNPLKQGLKPADNFQQSVHLYK